MKMRTVGRRAMNKEIHGRSVISSMQKEKMSSRDMSNRNRTIKFAKVLLADSGFSIGRPERTMNSPVCCR